MSIGNFSFGMRVVTNDVSDGCKIKRTNPMYERYNGEYEESPHGIYEYGEVWQSTGWVGYKSKYGVMALEHENSFYQDLLQNGIHRYQGTPYYDSRGLPNSFSVKSYRYNPFSLYYY